MAKNKARKPSIVDHPPIVVKQTMAKPVADYTMPDDLRSLMVNAKRLGRDDVWREAFQRLCVLGGSDQTDPLHRDFYEMLAAYEHLLSEKKARLTRATPTRQKVKNRGVVRCLEEWALSKVPTEGHELLMSKGLAELTGERLVLKYADQFSPEAVVAARARLEPKPTN